MAHRLSFSKFALWMSLVLLFCFSALSATFYAGVVSETDVSKSVISDKWMGVSGTVERGNDSLSGYQVGTLSLDENQTGEVLSAKLEGIQGGGYFAVFLPETGTDFETDQLSNLTDETRLEEDGLFSNETFPDFYPDYSQNFDNPKRTFDTGKEIKLGGEAYNASYADLSGKADMYLLEYSTGSDDIPAFISPIDGLNRESDFDKCYVSGCNFQALLPKLEGQDFSYEVNLVSKGESVTGCGEVEGNTTSIVIDQLGSQDNCLELSNPNTYVDFYNSEQDGSEAECGIKITSENVTLVDLGMKNFDKAVCTDGANTELMDGEFNSNSIGFSAQNSNLSISNFTIKNSGTAALALQGSVSDFQNVSLSGTPVYGKAESVSLHEYSDSLPRPGGISDELEPTGSRVKVESLSNDSRVENFGLGYPDVNTSKLLPDKIFKYDDEGNNYNITEFNADLISVGWEDAKYARYTGTITDFSIFSLYGEDITGDDSSGDQSSSSEDGTGSEGSGGGSGGGGAGGGGASFQPEPKPVKLNISLEEKLYNVKKGDTISIEFAANNTGEVTAENVTVGLESDWTSVPKTFEAVRPNESRRGTVLATIPEQAPEGNTTELITAEFEGADLDTEEFVVNVSSIVDDERIDVVESPPFVNLETSSSRYVGVQIENPTEEPINDIEVGFRGEARCAQVRDQTFSVPAESVENIQIELRTANQPDVCNDALVFRSGEDILGYAPMRVQLSDPSSNIVSVSAYIILLGLWTSLLAWRLRMKRGKQENRFI